MAGGLGGLGAPVRTASSLSDRRGKVNARADVRSAGAAILRVSGRGKEQCGGSRSRSERESDQVFHSNPFVQRQGFARAKQDDKQQSTFADKQFLEAGDGCWSRGGE